MSRWGILQVVALVLSVAAAVISYQLLLKHVTGSASASWFDAGCGDGVGGGQSECEAVLASPHSYFPPKFADKPDGRPHIPVALLGLIYYSTIFVWLLGVGRPSHDRRRLHWLPIALIALGLLASANFTRIMFSVIGEWCPWCLATHILNVLIAICFVVMWPRAPDAAADDETGDDAEPQRVAVSHPTGRLVWITLFAAGAVFYAELNMLGLNTWKKNATVQAVNLERCIAAVNRLTDDAASLVQRWEAQPKIDIPIGPDDPTRTSAEPGQETMNVIVFSDFECPSCQKFAVFLEEKAQGLFDGHLRTVFKHYPLNRACNEHVMSAMHAHACDAARMSEAARRLGGNDAFWRAHDLLFKHRKSLKQGMITPKWLAAKLRLDEKELIRAAESPEVAQRIGADVELAHRSHVRSTPAVFVEGRRLDTLAVRKIEFWDLLAHRFWLRAGVPRPSTTHTIKTIATPDTPGPTNGR